MKKFFNTTGPCNPEQHYILPPKERLIGADLERYLEYHLYWVLHAPRQTGKTTFMRSWMKEINSSGQGIACYVSVETAQGMTDSAQAMPNICQAIISFAKSAGLPILPDYANVDAGSMLKELMSRWAVECDPLPLIILFDEVDVLEGTAMVSFLRQLRSGFPERGIGKFPTSIVLVGMRDLRDYLAQSKDGIPVNPGSPFNIKQHSTTLGAFSSEDIVKLTGQHTEATGQVFSESAIERIFYWSSGQPWLTNAICQLCVWDIVKEETRETVTAEHVELAKEKLILSRATHIDALAERLKVPDIRAIVEPILLGELDPNLANTRAFDLCLDLGLITIRDGLPQIANRIYQEVIPRYLNYGMQLAIPPPEFTWKKNDGTMDMDALLKEFQKFWCRHSEVWEQKADYTEAFPHLLLMAYLQRVVNGGGQIYREYAAGRGRMDLLVSFNGKQHLIEIKLVYPADGREATLQEGIEQILRYADTVGADTLHLVIFDRRAKTKLKPWGERLGWEEIEMRERNIAVVWC